MSTVRPFRIYNGEVENMPQGLFTSDSSNVRNWDKIKYPNVLQIVKDLKNEYWVETEIRLGRDIDDYRNKLSPKERKAYNFISGKLNLLDSLAVDFNQMLSYVMTDQSIRSMLAVITYFENLHNMSYEYNASSVMNSDEKEEAFEGVKKIKSFDKQIGLIIPKIQKMIDTIAEYTLTKKEIDEDFVVAIWEGVLAYIILEGLYFNSGFYYFHSLAKTKRMLGTNNMINLIKEDETQHNVAYGEIMKIMMLEYPFLNTEERMDYAVKFINECVEAEKEWAKEVLGDIEIISLKEYNNYIEYLSNVSARNAGILEPFPENKELKSKWVVEYGSKKGLAKGDFFQTNVVDYAHSSEGFDL